MAKHVSIQVRLGCEEIISFLLTEHSAHFHHRPFAIIKPVEQAVIPRNFLLIYFFLKREVGIKLCHNSPLCVGNVS